MHEMLDLSAYQSFLGGGEFSDIYLEESSAFSIQWEDGRVKSILNSADSGAGLRFIKGEETRYGHTSLSDPIASSVSGEAKEKLGRLQAALANGLGSSVVVPTTIAECKTHPVGIKPSIISLDQKVEVLKRAFEATQISPLIRQVNINYGEKRKKIGYVNSKGESFCEEKTYLVFSLTVMAERDGDRQNAYESMGGISGFELFEERPPESIARLVAERALKKLEAPQAPTGEMPVVIASSAGGTLIHEAVGHSLEADAVLEGTSPAFLGKIEKEVANKKLTVFDNPTVPLKRGSYFYDDEGSPAEPSMLIEEGILKDYIFDRLSANKANRKSNGHGRRESYAHVPIPRMTNTYVAPGKDDPKEIVDQLKNGFLVTKMGGGQVDTANGDFVFEVEEGFHVQDGKKKMVRGATLLGNGPEVLMNITHVGNDHGWAIGTCGKEGQGAPVSDALPTVFIKKLVIGGQ